MPKILTVLGYNVVIYTHDHRPAHVHIEGPDGSCVFRLNCPSGPLDLRESHGLALTLVRRLARQIEPEIEALCAEWRRIHGRY